MTQHRSFAERVAAAFFGGIFGLLLGFGIMVAAYVADPAKGSQYQVLLATVAYCALFTFIFGEELADVWTMFFRAIGLLLSIESSVPMVDEPDASWIRPSVVFVVFVASLTGITYIVLD